MCDDYHYYAHFTIVDTWYSFPNLNYSALLYQDYNQVLEIYVLLRIFFFLNIYSKFFFILHANQFPFPHLLLPPPIHLSPAHPHPFLWKGKASDAESTKDCHITLRQSTSPPSASRLSKGSHDREWVPKSKHIHQGQILVPLPGNPHTDQVTQLLLICKGPIRSHAGFPAIGLEFVSSHKLKDFYASSSAMFLSLRCLSVLYSLVLGSTALILISCDFL